MDYTLLIFVVVLTTAIYGGLHYYVYRQFLHVFPKYHRALIACLIILAASLFVVEALNHGGFTRFISPLAWLAYLWMGFIFLFLFISGFFDFLELLSKWFRFVLLHKLLASKQRRIASSALVLLVGFQGYLNAQKINVETVSFSSEKIIKPLRIVQISDLHLGLLSQQKHIQALTQTINSLEPDIIVSTGDLVDMQPDHIRSLSLQLAQTKAAMGKYAVSGNHEVIAGLDKSAEAIQMTGFKLLSNSGVSLNDTINIIGVDDPSVSGNIYNNDFNERQLLKSYSGDLFTLLLKHQPVIDPESAGLFDLQLSGHTHGGQIFPFALLTKLVYPIGFGLSSVTKNQWIYVSRGTGTWGPPIRLLAKPEVTLILLKPL